MKICMKKGNFWVRLSALFFLLNLILSVNSQVAEQGKSFLWEIQADASKSYILGSVHLLKKEMYPLKAAVEKAFTDSDVLVVEADVSADKMMDVAALTMKKGFYVGEETLKDNISANTYNLVKDWLKKNNMDIEGFHKFKPWMLALTITSMELVKMGFDPNYGIDKYFLEKAAGKKEILELEGIQFQLNLFDGLTREENDQFLFASLQEISGPKEEFDRMIEVWLKGDADLMEDLVTKNIQKFPKLKNLYQKLTDDRNVKMLEKILSFLDQDKTYLIVVGAAHLVGKKGIIQLLRDRGFSLKQL